MPARRARILKGERERPLATHAGWAYESRSINLSIRTRPGAALTAPGHSPNSLGFLSLGRVLSSPRRNPYSR